EGAIVELWAGPRLDGTGSGDAAGRWSVSGGHRIDAHQLLVTAPGYLPLSRPDPDERALRLVLHRLPDLRGKVVDETGASVAGATLVLTRPGSPSEWSARSLDDGAFQLDGVPPGVYQVQVSSPEHDGYLTTV